MGSEMPLREIFAVFSIRRPFRRRAASHHRAANVESLEIRELLAADISVLKDIMPGAGNSVGFTDQLTPTEFKGNVYFGANDGTHGLELWRSNGSQVGTLLFADLIPGAAGSSPTGLTVANDKLFITTTNGMYVTDGTQQGTVQLLANLRPTSAFATLGNEVYFFEQFPPLGSTGIYGGGKFWKSDGTIAGTVSFETWRYGKGPRYATWFDNSLFFSAVLDPGTVPFYRFDPVTETITTVPGTPEYVIPRPVVTSRGLVFAGGNHLGPSGLYLLEFATSTATLTQPWPNGSDISDTKELITVNDEIYFARSTNGQNTELWKSDGTNAGTMMVKDINPGTSSSSPRHLMNLNGELFFTANDGVHGVELWKSGGLDSNTVLVKDLVPGAGSSTFGSEFIEFNSQLIFVANNKLQTTDGTTAGTIEQDSSPDFPGTPRVFGNNLIVAGQNNVVGREFFIARFGLPLAAPMITGPVSLTSESQPTITWDAVSGAPGYEVWIRNTSTGQNPFIRQSVIANSFTPSSGLGIGNYTVWVRSQGTSLSGQSAWSVPYSFRVRLPVSQPTVSGDPSNGRSMISWSPLPGAVKYDVWIDRLDVPTSPVFRDTNVNGTSITPTLPVGGKYRVWVRGLAADGTLGAWSVPTNFVAILVPAITSGLNPTFNVTPTVTWTSIPGAATYEFYIVRIEGYIKVLDQAGIVGTSFTWPSLPAGSYRYWVRATGAAAWSVPVDISTSGRTDLLNPSGTISTTKPNFSWRPVEGAVRYELWVNLLGVQGPIIHETNLTANSYQDNSRNLPSGNYRVWIRAIGSAATAAWSQPVDFSIARIEVPNEAIPELLVSVFDDSQLLSILERRVIKPVLKEAATSDQQQAASEDEHIANFEGALADAEGVQILSAVNDIARTMKDVQSNRFFL